MIVRNIVWRHARTAVVRNVSRPVSRFFSSPTDTIDSSTETNRKQSQSASEWIAPSPIDFAESEPETTSFDLTEESTEVSVKPSSPSQLAESVAAQYRLFKEQEQLIGTLGGDLDPHYRPNDLLIHPPTPADVTLELLLASEAHQGHATSLWNPANAQYIHGVRQGIHIISLEATAAHLRRAAKVVEEVTFRAGLVLFVATRPGQERAIVRAAELSKSYHLFERWIPGSITNGQQILGKCRTKVVNDRDEDVKGFEEQLLDRAVLKPDLVVCMNPLENYVLLHECALNNIPTIGVIDTNADPTWVTYPIPANDDSLRCIEVIAGVLGRAGEAGKNKRLAAAEQGTITYRPSPLQVPELPQEEDEETSEGRRAMRRAAINEEEPAEPLLTEETIAEDNELTEYMDDDADGPGTTYRVKKVV